MAVCRTAIAALFLFQTSVASATDVTDGESKPSQFIINGEVAKVGRYPYAVGLVTTDGSHFCGGSLITPNTVLSAAHCAFDQYGNNVGIPAVHIGKHTWDGKFISDEYETFTVEETILHPDFKMTEYYATNDLAVIKLNGRSTFEPVVLNSDPNLLNTVNAAGLTVMGWGLTSEDGTVASDELMKVDVEWVPNEICEMASHVDPVTGAMSSYDGFITDDMLCAANPVKDADACKGDSGGPLVVEGADPSLDVQVGVVSWGYGCAHEVYPGVYSRVSYNFDWIKDIACNGADSYFVPSLLCGSTTSPTEGQYLTVQIKLDMYPSETGWSLQTADGTLIGSAAPNGYSDENVDMSYQVVTEKVFIPNDIESLQFFVIDTHGDGLSAGNGGWYAIYAGDVEEGNLLASGGRAFKFVAAHTLGREELFGTSVVDSDGVHSDGGNKVLYAAPNSGSTEWSTGLKVGVAIGVLAACFIAFFIASLILKGLRSRRYEKY